MFFDPFGRPAPRFCSVLVPELLFLPWEDLPLSLFCLDTEHVFKPEVLAGSSIFSSVTANLPQERFLHNIEHRGNTSSASIPVLLDEKIRDGVIKRGDMMVFNGFGAGFVTSAAVMRY